MVSKFDMIPAADRLEGMLLDESWRVLKKKKQNPGETPGVFSVGYFVENEVDGSRGFLKALDYSSAFDRPNMPELLPEMLKAYNFEKDLLYECQEYKMRNVVRPLHFGYIVIPEARYYPRVDYIIMEKADGDCRQQLGLLDSFEMAWKFRTLHQIAKGMQQLHLRQIAHQDLKPANVLIFSDDESKVGDLGSASVKAVKFPRDQCKYAGDPDYAPFELLYDQISGDWIQRRFGCDAYLFGGLIYFFVSNMNITPVVIEKLEENEKPRKWSDSYSLILPRLRSVWIGVIDDFRREIEKVAGTHAEDIANMVYQLTEPNPDLRGNPITRSYKFGNPYSLERYISLLDRLAKRARLGLLLG